MWEKFENYYLTYNSYDFLMSKFNLILISDAQVLIYNSSDGAVSSSPMIDASKLGLYG